MNEANVTIKFARTFLNSSNDPGDGYSFEDKCVEQMDTQASAFIQDIAKKVPRLAVYILKKPNELKVQIMVEGLGNYKIDEQNPTHASIDINNKLYADIHKISLPGNDTDHAGSEEDLP